MDDRRDDRQTSDKNRLTNVMATGVANFVAPMSIAVAKAGD